MIRLLRFLITGDWHLHQWEDKGHANVFTLDDNGNRIGTLPQRIIVRCQCRHCGAWRAFTIK